MAVRILCPECNKKLSVSEEAVGRKVRCSGCKSLFLARTVGDDEPNPHPREDEVVARRSRPREDDETSPHATPRGEEERPRRRSVREDDEQPRRAPRSAGHTKGVSVFGVISLVLGVLGLPLSLIPCVNFVGLPLVAIGLLLGVIGLFVARSGQKSGTGIPIAGSAVCLVGLIIALGWIGVMALFVKDAQQKQAQEEQELRGGQAITITAAELHKQYQANQPGADNKYKEKILELTGTVSRVTGGIGADGPTVEFKADDEDEQTIDCEFPISRKQEVANFKPGQQVTIRGRCKGVFLGSVTVEKCLLKSPAP